MELKLGEIAQRIKSLRDIMGFSTFDMAKHIGCNEEEYINAENGEVDFSFTFIYKCAEKLNIDIIELLTGEGPKLSFYTIVRNGNGLPMKRRSGFNYYHLGSMLKDKLCEPFLVSAPFSQDEQDKPIQLNTHSGQEFNYILSGSLKITLDKHTEVLNEGDSILYDSSYPHGMIATGNRDCTFLAIILKKNSA